MSSGSEVESGSGGLGGDGVGVARAVRVPPELRHSAALRLVPPGSPNPSDAAKRLVSGAAASGIDIDLIFGTVEPASGGRPAWVRHAVLIVRGAGRTAMVFQGSKRGDEGPRDRSERAACLAAAREYIATITEPTPEGVTRPAIVVLQSLPDPDDTVAIDAMVAEGFVRVGDLSYLRRPVRGADRSLGVGKGLPEGFTTRVMTTARPGSGDHAALRRALESSYDQTLDCPELCGMRETVDVIESHRSTGTFDPTLWTLVFRGGEPVGCALFNPVPENRSAELVYLGLGPAARGKGLGRTLLERGIAQVSRLTRASEVLCAVDERNGPALDLYRRAGFSAFSRRVAFVRLVSGSEGP